MDEPSPNLPADARLLPARGATSIPGAPVMATLRAEPEWGRQGGLHSLLPSRPTPRFPAGAEHGAGCGHCRALAPSPSRDQPWLVSQQPGSRQPHTSVGFLQRTKLGYTDHALLPAHEECLRVLISPPARCLTGLGHSGYDPISAQRIAIGTS